MAQHIYVKSYFKPSENTVQAMLTALPIQTQAISSRITMVADNPRTGLSHRLIRIISPEASTIHWAMDQHKIDHLMLLGSITDNTASWRYGHRDTNCCRVAYNTLAVSEAAVHMCWQYRRQWREKFDAEPTETEAVIFNIIAELNAQHQRRLERVEERLLRRQQQRVQRLTEAAHKRAEQKVRTELAAKAAVIERFKQAGPSQDTITAVIRDPVYRFTVGIANSQMAPEKTGTDK